jgi:hypothetical protein
MTGLSGPLGLAPPSGTGYRTNTALLAVIRNPLAAADQITGCDCRACLGAPDPPICSIAACLGCADSGNQNWTIGALAVRT